MPLQISTDQALHRAAALCSRTEQCRSDIEEKLKKWGIGSADIKKILDQLIREKFLDEKRFCNSFVNDKFRFNKWGRIKISYALKQKRVPDNLIDESLQVIDEEKYIDTLSLLLKTKRKSICSENNYEIESKLLRFAASRGFEPHLIMKLLKNKV